MKHLPLIVICITLLSACDTQRANDEAVAGSADSLYIALKNTIEESIVPGVSSFRSEAESLQAEAGTFCSAINQANLVALQNQWKTLSTQWNRIAMYNIGPLNDDLFTPNMIFIESMRLRGTDYTNTIRGELAARLSDTTVLDQSYFDALNFKFVGMLALEVLIFEDSVSQSTELANIVSDYQAAGTGDRKCEYLIGMAQLLERTAIEVDDGWQIDYMATGTAFKDSLLNGELEDGSEPVPALITVIQEHLDYLKKRKLEAILDAQIADYFYQNISASLDAVEDVLQGANEDSYSFFDQMLAGGFEEQVDVVKTNLASARQAVANEDRSALATAIGLLDGNFKREVPDSLEVVLTINFTDGD